MGEGKIQLPSPSGRGAGGEGKIQLPSPAYAKRSPRGFTLVELLVVVTIIAMLAGVVLGALSSARETARIAKTRSTIAKIDRFIMAKYESYRTRRLPLGRTGIQSPHIRWNATRDLMRMEMPDRWNDIVAGDSKKQRGALFLPLAPSLAERYYSAFDRAYDTLANQPNPPPDEKIREKLHSWGPAECLYQVVMAIPGAAKQFQDSEIGDYDEDGLREFHDAWGRPIMFIRWPAGFLPERGADTELQTSDAPDPFDPERMLASGSYVLYPLIFSAGSDGVYDIHFGDPEEEEDVKGVEKPLQDPVDMYFRYIRYVPDPKHKQKIISKNLNPFSPYWTSQQPLMGTPFEREQYGTKEWYDNIHNHHFDLR